MTETYSSYDQDSNCITELHAPRRHRGGEKGMLDSKSWQTFPWLIIVLDEGPSLQFLANLEEILSFLKFWLQNRFFCPTRRATRCALMIGTSSGGKIDIFGFFMVNYACSGMAERFHQVLGGLKGQKHPKIGLSATFYTHRDQFWEIEVLEGKINTKSRNYTWVG